VIKKINNYNNLERREYSYLYIRKKLCTDKTRGGAGIQAGGSADPNDLMLINPCNK
jgi:hypothetical protein